MDADPTPAPRAPRLMTRLARPMPAPCVASREVAAGPWRLHARVAEGAAPPGATAVVLVHGLGMSSRYMAPLARALAPHLAVHAPDLPGFGRSERPRRALDTGELAEAVLAYMDAAGLARAALLGNSYGCEIVVEVARRCPERVERLVLQGPTPDADYRPGAVQALGLLATAPLERPAILWVGVTDYLRAGPRRYLATFREMMRHSAERTLGEVQAPALVVVGARDPIVREADARRFAEGLPRGRVAVVPGAAHGMVFSHPERLRDAILPFLMGL